MNIESSLDSIETARRFVVLLGEAVVESKRDIESDLKREADANFPRRRDAIQLILSKLQTLDLLMAQSRRALNDLRSLHRVMFEARATLAVAPVAAEPLPKAAAEVVSSKRRAVSARIEAQPQTADHLQIMPWYLRTDARPDGVLKRAA